MTIEHVGSEPLHEPSTWHVLWLDPVIEYPVAQVYVATPLEMWVYSLTFTASGLVGVKLGHVTTEHVGLEPLHFPSAWHDLVLDPDKR